MTAGNNHSYLDMSVLPALRDAVLSDLAVIVFSPDAQEITWANASGARVFGGSGVVDLLTMSIPPGNPFMKQLRHALEQMNDRTSIIRGFRIGSGSQAQLLQFEIERISTGSGDMAIRLAHIPHEHHEPADETILARAAVSSLEGFASAAAILDDAGMPLAFSNSFGQFGPDIQTLENLVAELKNEEDRLIKRPLKLDDDAMVAVGIARLADNPGRNLIVVAAETGNEDNNELGQNSQTSDEPLLALVEPVHAEPELEDIRSTDDMHAFPDGTNEGTAPAEASGEPNSTEPQQEPEPSSSPVLADDAPAASGIEREQELDPDQEQAPESEQAYQPEPEECSTDAQVESDLEHDNADTDHELPASEKDEARASELDSDQQTTMADEPVSRQVPVGLRFTWSTDQDYVFKSISEEFTAAVGNATGDIEGKEWHELAAEFGFDSDGEISRLFDSRDTWSGKIVDWPLDGETQRRARLELSALPTFNADREFCGYNGFGLIADVVSFEPEVTKEISGEPETQETQETVEEETFEQKETIPENINEMPESDTRNFVDESQQTIGEGNIYENDDDEFIYVLEADEESSELPFEDEEIPAAEDEDARQKELSATDELTVNDDNHAEEFEDSEEEDGGSPLDDDEVEQDEIEPAIRLTSEEDEDFDAGADLVDSDDEDGEDLANVVLFGDGKSGLTKDEWRAFKTVRQRLSENDPSQSLADITPQTKDRTDTSLIDKLPVAVLIYLDERILYANRKFLKASGYDTVEELVESVGVSDILGATDDDSDRNQGLLFKKDGTQKNIDPVLHTVPWQGEKAALLSFTDQQAGRFGIGAESGERISAIQNLLDTTSDGIVLMDETGHISSLNTPAQALFGVETEEVIGKEFIQLFAPESRKSINGYLSNLMEGGIERLINDGAEAIAQEAGGGFIPVFITATRIDSSGKLCAILRDITNWKKAEEEMLKARREAERTSEQKSEFLAQVSHEIRTPLTAIIGFSDAMIEERFGPIDNPRYLGYLNDIKRSGTHVLEIINGLLDLSRIEAGRLDLSFEAVDLNEMVAETVAMLQPQANENRTIIRTSLSRSVPKVVADPRSIRQIILNLVSNAIKYSQTNSQVIVSTVYESNGEVALRIRDTGHGMSNEQVARAMEPFRQAHDITERSVQGSGLGLPLTKALVEANRAYFELESEPGHGTIAHVQFPSQRVLGE